MRKLIKTKFLPIFLILTSLILLLLRAKYSFCWSDESFYFATSSRFYNGDSIFKHDWFPTQLSSVALLPLYSLYIRLVGSSAGIILYFRTLFVILETICALTIFFVISKNHGAFLGTATALLTQWYIHLNIATLSYYTMSLLFSLLTVLFLYDCYMDSKINKAISSGYLPHKKSQPKLFLAGIFFAIAVLCLPTLVIPYFIIVIAGFALTLLKKTLTKKCLNTSFIDSIDFVYIFSWTFAGILVPAIIFFIFLITNVSILDFIKAVPYVLSDEEHITSLIFPIKRMYLSIIDAFGSSISKIGFLFILLCLTVFIMILVVSRVNSTNVKKKFDQILLYLRPFLFVTDCILFILYLKESYTHTGFIFTALMLFSIPIFLLSEHKNWHLFILTVVYGLIFSLVYSYSSFCDLYVLSMGHFIAAIGGIILAYDFIKEIKINTKIFTIIYGLIICVSILITMNLRINNIYRDDKLDNLVKLIETGPAKGLYTSTEHYEMYNDVYDAIINYCMKDENHSNLFISKLLPFGYMISDMKVAAPSTWRNTMDSKRVEEYYKINPEKIPDTILLLKEEYGAYETCGDVEKDPTPNENSEAGFLYSYIEDNNFIAIDIPCGTVYKKP